MSLMGWPGRAPTLQDIKSCGGLRSTRSTSHVTKFAQSTAVSTIGIDLGKNSFHLVGLDQRGAIVLQLKCSRAQLERRLTNIPSCLIGMEHRPPARRAWTRCSFDPCAIREAVPQRSQERLPR